MSKIIGKAMCIKDGQEYDIDITCCQKAKTLINDLLSLEKKIKEILELVNPKIQSGYLVIYPAEKLELNYCPVCGDKL